MAKLRVLSGQQVCRIPVEQGFIEVRQRGSQIIMQLEAANLTVNKSSCR